MILIPNHSWYKYCIKSKNPHIKNLIIKEIELSKKTNFGKWACFYRKGKPGIKFVFSV